MRARRRIALYIAGVFVAFLLLSGALVCEHARHVCTDEHCRTCAVIVFCENLLRSLAALAILRGFRPAIMAAPRFGGRELPARLRLATLVSLKAKLSC